MPIATLDQLLERAQGGPPRTLVVAWPQDGHTLAAVHQAVVAGLVEGMLTGDADRIRSLCAEEGLDPARFRILPAETDTEAAARAVACVRSGEARILMKGSLSSDRYMRAILDRERGLVPPGGILCHVGVVQHPRYPKLLVCGDMAVIPEPDLEQKAAILRALVRTAQALGVARPRVALVAASEQVLPRHRPCTDAAALAAMAEEGHFPGALVQGPMGLDVAVDPEAAAIKGVGGPVAGQADALLFANLEAGNVFYKTSTKLAGAELAALVAGAAAPCILSSRGDSTRTKLLSIALAALTLEA